jgi:hypothetical protein
MFVAESLAKSARVASSCKTGHSEVESNHGRVTSKPEVDFPIADHCEVEVQGFI